MPSKDISFQEPSTTKLDMTLPDRQTFKVVRLLKACALVCAFEAMFTVAMRAQTASAQGPNVSYSGPAVLGRSLGASVSPRSEQVRFRFFGSARAVYDSGLTGVRLETTGEPSNFNGYGWEFTGGVYGMKNWKRTQVSLGYAGGYRDYASSGAGSGQSHSLLLGVTQTINPRVIFNSTVSAATVTRAYGYGYGFQRPGNQTDPAFDLAPTDDVYDSRITFITNSNSMVFQLSPRMQASANGGVFLTKRAGALISGQGIFAGGDLSKRLTRTQTISVNYNFNRFNFSNRYGGSFIHGVGVGWGVALSRRWELSLNGGVARVESEGVQNVVLSPEVAAIIGQTHAAQAFYRKSYYPTYQGRITGKFRKYSVAGGYRQNIMPGNGSFLTSRVESATAGYSYNGFRKINIGAMANYNRLNNLLLTSGRATSMSAGVNVGYQLRRDVQLTFSAMARRFDSGGSSTFNRDGVRLAVGIAYSPGEIPLALW